MLTFLCRNSFLMSFWMATVRTTAFTKMKASLSPKVTIVNIRENSLMLSLKASVNEWMTVTLMYTCKL